MAGLKATVKWGKGGGGWVLFKDIFGEGLGREKNSTHPSYLYVVA